MDCTQFQSVDIQPAIVPRLPSVATSVVNSIAAHVDGSMSSYPMRVALPAVCNAQFGVFALSVDAMTPYALHVWQHSIVI